MIIYSDMDGTCANLVEGLSIVNKRSHADIARAWNLRKEVMWQNTLNLTPEEFEYSTATYHSPEFWANLPPIGGYDYFYRKASNLGEIVFLSAADDPNHIKGKEMWLDKYYPNNKRIFHKKKYEYANKNTILVDDNHDQLELFVKAGGQGVLVPQLWNDGKVFEGRKTWDTILHSMTQICTTALHQGRSNLTF